MLALCLTTELYSSCIPATLCTGPAHWTCTWTFLGGLRKENFHPRVLRMPLDCRQSCKYLMLRKEPQSYLSGGPADLDWTKVAGVAWG